MRVKEGEMKVGAGGWETENGERTRLEFTRKVLQKGGRSWMGGE